MLSAGDYQEAARRYKDMQGNGHERQRYHALILVHQGYSYREVGQILLVDEETSRRWVQQDQEPGLGGRKTAPQGGGEHGQRELSAEQLDALKRSLREEARPGTPVGRGWTNQAVRQLVGERLGVQSSKSGGRKVFAPIGWSYQRGRKLSIRRDPADQGRQEGETRAVLAKYARSGKPVVPLASAQSKVYVEGTLGRRWHPMGEQPRVADGARRKQAENLQGAVHWGTGAEGAPFASDWQDRDATSRWQELLLAECPEGQMRLGQDQAPPHPSEEGAEWLETQPRIAVSAFPTYTPAENPKEATWKDLKAEVSPHHWQERMADLSAAINGYYQAGKKHVVTFLEKFGYRWVEGVIQPLPQPV